jgi:hypothetical protein
VVAWIKAGDLVAFRTAAGQFRIAASEAVAFSKRQGLLLPEQTVDIVLLGKKTDLPRGSAAALKSATVRTFHAPLLGLAHCITAPPSLLLVDGRLRHTPELIAALRSVLPTRHTPAFVFHLRGEPQSKALRAIAHVGAFARGAAQDFVSALRDWVIAHHARSESGAPP